MGDAVIPSVQYPNPGYLGSSSHTTLFDQLRFEKDIGPSECIQEHVSSADAPTDYTVDEIRISRGAEFILELHRGSIIRSLARLFEIWITKGTNLALAGPFTGPCAATVTRMLSQCDGGQATALEISRELFYHSRRPISFYRGTLFDDYCGNFVVKMLDGSLLAFSLLPSAEPL